MIKVKTLDKFDHCGMEASIEMIKKNIATDLNVLVEIFPKENIVKLNIPFSELYHKCSNDDWEMINEHIKNVMTQSDLPPKK